MNSHEVFIHIHQGCFAGTGAIVRLPQCQWSKPDGYGKISQCITTTKHSKAKTVCIFFGIYCTWGWDIGCLWWVLTSYLYSTKVCAEGSEVLDWIIMIFDCRLGMVLLNQFTPFSYCHITGYLMNIRIFDKRHCSSAAETCYKYESNLKILTDIFAK